MKIKLILISIVFFSLTEVNAQRKYWEIEAHNNFVLRKGYTSATNDYIRENPNNYSVKYMGASLSRNLICIGNLNFGLGLSYKYYEHRILDFYQFSHTYNNISYSNYGVINQPENATAPFINPFDDVIRTNGVGFNINLKYRLPINRNNNFEIGLTLSRVKFKNTKRNSSSTITGDQINAFTTQQSGSNFHYFNTGYQHYNSKIDQYSSNYGRAILHNTLGLSGEYIHMTTDRTSIGLLTKINFTLPREKNLYYASLHGMITGSLGLSFRFYKPKYKKLNFFEDKHLDKSLFKRKR
ncbi:MAG: hypothetical protein ACI9XP_000901 [Lentimonas sp.]|jgi:hypothetical protein